MGWQSKVACIDTVVKKTLETPEQVVFNGNLCRCAVCTALGVVVFESETRLLGRALPP